MNERKRTTGEEREDGYDGGGQKREMKQIPVYDLCVCTQTITLWPVRKKNERFPSLFSFFLLDRRGRMKVE